MPSSGQHIATKACNFLPVIGIRLLNDVVKNPVSHGLALDYPCKEAAISFHYLITDINLWPRMARAFKTKYPLYLLINCCLSP